MAREGSSSEAPRQRPLNGSPTSYVASSARFRAWNRFCPCRPNRLALREVRLVTTDAELAALCAHLANRKFIALDVETTLFERDLCLIQVGVDEFSAVIDPRAPIDLEPLARIFESQAIVKVIHNATFERSVLQRANMSIANIFDTLAASRRIRGRQPDGHSLAAVCRRELDKTIDKSQQTSDWTRRPLSAAQIAYAALDVEVLVALYVRFTGLQPELNLS